MIEFALPVFGLILAGYAAGKTPIMPATAVVGLSNFAVYAAVPSLMFRTLARGGVAQSLTAPPHTPACRAGWRRPCGASPLGRRR